MSGDLTERVRLVTEGWSDEARAELLRRMDRLRRRLATVRQYPTALDLQARHEVGTVRTPALELVNARTNRWNTTPDDRLVVSGPPQEFKSTHLKWLILHMLIDNPELRVIYITYAEFLARRMGREVRNLIETYGEDWGISVAQDHRDARDWGLTDHRGGLVCVQVGGSVTGRAGDRLIIDDPLKGREQADSEIVRDHVDDAYTGSARTRLAPGSPILLVQARWHEDDLAGRRLAEGGWELVNLPALADGQTPDALGRPAGTYLESTRGRTPADWEALRVDVGPRDWAALYQGRPAPLEGGIFKRQWIDQHRVHGAPPLARVEVGVDPADTGTGDAAGILVAGRSADAHLYLLADYSGPFSQAQWARTACLAAVRHNAACIVVERNLGMGSSVRDAWALIWRQAAALLAADDIDLTAAALAAAGDLVAADRAQLAELVSLLPAVAARPSTGPRVVLETPKQSKQVRAESITSLYENGRVHHVGQFADLEHEMLTWQPHQPSPNRLDTLAHLLRHLDGITAAVVAKRADPQRTVPVMTAPAAAWTQGREPAAAVLPAVRRATTRRRARVPRIPIGQ